jgi:hypothetical protein
MGLSREFVIKIVEILGDAVVAAMVKEAITEAVSEVYQHVAAFLKTRKQKQLPTTIETQVQIASGPEKQALTGQDLKPLIEEALKQAAQQHGPIKAEVSQKTTTETTVTFFIP